MLRHLVMTTAFALALLVPLFATAPPATADQQPVYGSQLMNEQERLEYRQRMRTAPSEEQRQRIRAEHHQRMQERARQQGMTLPDEPPVRGMGARQGMGPGQGMGPKGGGRGPGK